MGEVLDLTLKINCKNEEEVNSIKKEVAKFKRRIAHIKNRPLNYEATITNFENKEFQIVTNKKGPGDFLLRECDNNFKKERR